MTDMIEAAEEDRNEDTIFARIVGKYVLMGFPIAWVVITLGVWVATGEPFGRSVTAAALASVLMGAFGGGFAGTVVATIKTEH